MGCHSLIVFENQYHLPICDANNGSNVGGGGVGGEFQTSWRSFDVAVMEQEKGEKGLFLKDCIARKEAELTYIADAVNETSSIAS